MKTEEQFSDEEKAALAAMETDEPADELVEEPGNEPAPEADDPAKAEEPAPEPDSDEKPEFKSSRTDKPPEGFVPHQAMHAERMRRQELERKIAELEEKIAPPEPKDEAPKYVDPLEDPEGFRKYDEHRRKEESERWEKFQAQQEAQSKARQRFSEASRLEAEFAAQTPDYQEAARFLHDTRLNELASQGYGQQEIKAQIARDANALFDAAQAAGMNPAQLLYYRAQQAGYAKEQNQQPPDERAKLEAEAKAQRQTQGLGQSAGAQSGKLTADQLAQMSEKELAKVPEEEIQRLFGG